MSYGANQYRRTEGGAMSPRDTEASAFVFVNRLLAQPGDPEARMRGLAKNQQLWSLLLRDVSSSMNALPPILKADLTKVGLFAMRQSIAAMGDKSRSIAPLIQINDDMIAALRSPSANHGPTSSAEERLSLAG
jgi:flagellar biosynthesis regulator FlaF